MNSDGDRCHVLCSEFALQNAFHKLQLFSETRNVNCRKFFAAILLKKLSRLKIALFRFKYLKVSRKRLPSLIATYYNGGAYNRHTNRTKRWFVVKLRRISLQKQRICSTIYKWRYSLLHNFICVWLQRTRFNAQLKRRNLKLVSRNGSGFSFGEFNLLVLFLQPCLYSPY